MEDGDDALFHAAVADARPLADRARVRAPRGEGRGRRASAALAPLSIDRDAGTGRGRDVGDAELARLAAGKLRPEASLDLHGRSEADAAAALERFLVAARAEHRRCVIVVTGKGLHSGGAPILRHAVPDLLSGRLAGHVRAFAPARAADGGDGALYVLLTPSRRTTP